MPLFGINTIAFEQYNSPTGREVTPLFVGNAKPECSDQLTEPLHLLAG